MRQLVFPIGPEYAGHRQCACGVWMLDDARPHCAVCELRRAPHVVRDGKRWVWVEGSVKP